MNLGANYERRIQEARAYREALHPRNRVGEWRNAPASLKRDTRPMFHGVPLERGVAYQGELTTGEIVTMRATGITGPYGAAEFRDADTGRRHDRNEDSFRWFDRLDRAAGKRAATEETHRLRNWALVQGLPITLAA